jgi:NAD+ synthase
VELPNYGVFDEKRVFAVGPMPGPINFRGVRIGVPICEDIWEPDVCETLEEPVLNC